MKIEKNLQIVMLKLTYHSEGRGSAQVSERIKNEK